MYPRESKGTTGARNNKKKGGNGIYPWRKIEAERDTLTGNDFVRETDKGLSLH